MGCVFEKRKRGILSILILFRLIFPTVNDYQAVSYAVHNERDFSQMKTMFLRIFEVVLRYLLSAVVTRNYTFSYSALGERKHFQCVELLETMVR